MELYPHSNIEKKAQRFWLENKSFATNTNDHSLPKFYCLTMFPYPSGSLHMGHVRTYVIGDVLNRYKKMSNFNVLHPMGWDAFGLPAENAAILNNTSPREWTYKNISTMKAQLISLGCGYDWDREISTCEPEYYKHQQWFFIQLFNKNLAYKKKSLVYWDPVDQTVLANEQVIDGRGWRSGAQVEIREIEQWFLKVTSYSEDLYNNLDTMSDWPESLREVQKNWIGKSSGFVIKFALHNKNDSFDQLEVFTTFPETIMEVTYVALATRHPLTLQLASQDQKISDFIEQYSTVKKECADFVIHGLNTGLHVIHPITGLLLPLWISNYVHEEYATGCVMGVPSRDQNDRLFADKYVLPFAETANNKHQEAISLFLKDDKLVTPRTYYRLRDWGISRQRYWGCPIPIVYCKICGVVPEALKNLPVLIHSTAGKPASYVTNCPNCGASAEREKDTFDTFVESSWYYARYICPKSDIMLDHSAKSWLPVDQYIGGMEHATLHFLYARFFYRLMQEFDLVDQKEPFLKVLNQGLILKDGAKMSKSKGNIINPQEVMDKYGADVLRLFIINAAPIDKSFEWDDAAIAGSERFIKKLWSYAKKICDLSHYAKVNSANQTNESSEIKQAFSDELSRALQDMNKTKLNTVVSSCMKMLELIRKGDVNLGKSRLHILLRLLHPFAPHITHYLWQELKMGTDILCSKFPDVIESDFKSDHFILVVQINGKKVGTLSLMRNLSPSEVEEYVLSSNLLLCALGDRKIARTIYIEGRIINLLTKAPHE